MVKRYVPLKMTLYARQLYIKQFHRVIWYVPAPVSDIWNSIHGSIFSSDLFVNLESLDEICARKLLTLHVCAIIKVYQTLHLCLFFIWIYVRVSLVVDFIIWICPLVVLSMSGMEASTIITGMYEWVSMCVQDLQFKADSQ